MNTDREIGLMFGTRPLWQRGDMGLMFRPIMAPNICHVQLVVLVEGGYRGLERRSGPGASWEGRPLFSWLAQQVELFDLKEFYVVVHPRGRRMEIYKPPKRGGWETFINEARELWAEHKAVNLD